QLRASLQKAARVAETERETPRPGVQRIQALVPLQRSVSQGDSPRAPTVVAQLLLRHGTSLPRAFRPLENSGDRTPGEWHVPISVRGRKLRVLIEDDSQAKAVEVQSCVG